MANEHLALAMHEEQNELCIKCYLRFYLSRRKKKNNSLVIR